MEDRVFSTDKEKLSAILQFLQMNVAEFATYLGVEKDQLYNLKTGKTNIFDKPNADKLACMLRREKD